MRCNNQASIYIDGEFRHSTTSATEVWTGDLPWGASLISVSCRNTWRYGGLTAAFSNGLVIGEDWQCADEVESDWYMPTYNVSLWENAVAIQSNWQNGVGTLLNFPSYAKWMWSGGSYYYVHSIHQARTTHCRGTIGIDILTLKLHIKTFERNESRCLHKKHVHVSMCLSRTGSSGELADRTITTKAFYKSVYVSKI